MATWARLGVIRAPLERILEAVWSHLGIPLGILKAALGYLKPSGGHVGALMGVSWDHLAGLGRALKAILEDIDQSRGGP